ncbi:MAG: hypothetical protein J6N52_13115 [Clostridia bacterium]|nr:hypothetical protein [Clostridia bacterium]
MNAKKILSSIIAAAIVLGTMSLTAFAEVGAESGNGVAEIGGTKFETLDAAIAAAQSGDTITLLDNINLDEGKRIEIKDKGTEMPITLNLSGFELSGNNKASFTTTATTYTPGILYVSGSKVVIKDDSNKGQKGAIINNYSGTSKVAAIIAETPKTSTNATYLEVNDGVRIESAVGGDKSYGIVVHTASSTLKTEAVINDAVVKAGMYAVYHTNANSSCVINGGRFESNYSTAVSGKSNLTINKGLYSKLSLTVMQYIPREEKCILLNKDGYVEPVDKDKAVNYPAHLSCTNPTHSQRLEYNRIYTENDLYPLMQYTLANDIIIEKDVSVTYPDNTYLGAVYGAPTEITFDIKNGAKLSGTIPLATAKITVNGGGAEGVFRAYNEDYAITNNGTDGVYECSIAPDKRAVTITSGGEVFAFRDGDSINSRLSKLTEPATIDLLTDYTTDTACSVLTDTTINLNGNTYTYTGTGTGAFGVRKSNITLTINKGTITGETNKEGTILTTAKPTAKNTLLYIYKSYSGSKIVIGEDVYLKGNTILIEGTNNTLEFNGNISTVGASQTAAIMGNGNTTKNSTFIIGEKAVISSDSNCAAIFHPQPGKLIVNGGSITGGTAIYMKSGDLIVNGGTITANGAKDAYTPTGSGADITGDAIVLDACGYPGGAPTASITGGTVTATGEGTKAVECYRKDDTVADIENKNFITGGTFSSDVKDYAAESYEAKVNPDGTYEVTTIFGRIFYMKDLPMQDGKYLLGLYAGIDSLNYKNVGFSVTAGGTTLESTTDIVYTSIKGTNMKVTAADIGAYRIFGVNVLFPETYAGEEITFSPFAVNFDGSRIYGNLYTVNDIYTK